MLQLLLLCLLLLCLLLNESLLLTLSLMLLFQTHQASLEFVISLLQTVFFFRKSLFLISLSVNMLGGAFENENLWGFVVLMQLGNFDTESLK